MNVRNKILGPVSVVILCAALAAAGLASGTTKPASSPPPSELKLPVIIRVVARPLCTGLHRAIGPAIGLMLQNNAIIAKSQPLFDDYQRYNEQGSIGKTARQLAQVKMEYLIGPLVKNTAQIDNILANSAIFNQKAGSDSRKLVQIKKGLIQALSVQKTAIDLINGFVTTKQLANMQHAGFEYVGSINGSKEIPTNALATPTPNPNFYNNNYAGLAPQQYGNSAINLNNLPGLSIGYNPISAIAHAMRVTRARMIVRQNQIAPKIVQAGRECSAVIH